MLASSAITAYSIRSVSCVKATMTRRFACRAVREKPALNETRPPAAIAKRRVVFRVMNTELNNMRLSACVTFTADRPPDGFSIRRLLAYRTVRERLLRTPPLALDQRFIALDDLIVNFSVYLPRLFPFRLAKSGENPRSRFAFAFHLDAFVRQKPWLLATVKSRQDCKKKIYFSFLPLPLLLSLRYYAFSIFAAVFCASIA